MQHHKVVISDDAQEMVKEHVRFLSKISVSAAKRLRKEIMTGIRSLAYMPERFPYFDPDQQDPGYRKMCPFYLSCCWPETLAVSRIAG